MKNIAKIKESLTKHKQELQKKFHLKTIGVFGSYVRNEAKQRSDLDILVEFAQPVGLFEFMDLEEYLSKLLKVKVDLVSKKALKPYIERYILEEVVHI